MQPLRWTGILAATSLAGLLLGVAAVPSPHAGFSLDDIRRPIYRGNTRAREIGSDREVILTSDISVAGAHDGRAAATFNAPSTSPTPMAESLKMVTKQLLQAPGATDMVATDVRTPPRVKSQVTKQESPDFVPLGKGEAEPVQLEEASSYDVITAAPDINKPTPTPSSTGGLSTWILLSNGEQSTLASNKKKPSNKETATSPTTETKKGYKSTTSAPIIDKPTKKSNSNKTSPGKVTSVLASMVRNSTQQSPKASPLILQDSKFKNRTPIIVGKIPAVNRTDLPPTTVSPSTIPTKKLNSTVGTPITSNTIGNGVTILTRKRPASTSPSPPTKYIHDIVPTTSLVIEPAVIIDSVDETTTETSSTTTKTRRPSHKKKKKNKNRRRRPTKGADTAESKIEETSVSATKIDPNRPISTRIYNYLAREVMPSVGVGIVGLVLTAGLAGLFLYPFGGGIARRNYNEKGGVGGSGGSDHPMYYYNSYTPHPQHDLHGGAGGEIASGQPEEKVFGQVLSSMNHNSFSPSYDTKYTTSNNKYRYDLHEYGQGNVNGYAGSSDYSTLPDSLKTPEFGDNVKPVDFTTADSSKYYSMDPATAHYKLTDSSSSSIYKEEPEGNNNSNNNYPSLTEYASYTNPADVGTVDSYKQPSENITEPVAPPIAEDKSDKSQPQFSALVGSPPFTNTDFVGSVSLTGSYGTQDNHHRMGALAAAEHGPRSLKDTGADSKVTEKKLEEKRERRDVHDDFSNEIDADLGSGSIKPFPSLSQIVTTSASSAEEVATTITSTTPEEEAEVSTTPVTGGSSESTENNKAPEPTSPAGGTQGSSGGGFLGFITRLAEVKMKIGISLLRSTGQALQKYLNVVAQRMEAAVRTIEANTSNRTPSQWRMRRTNNPSSSTTITPS